MFEARFGNWLWGCALALLLATPAAADWGQPEFNWDSNPATGVLIGPGDARGFGKADLSTLDRNPWANQGWFVTFDLQKMSVNSPEPQTIGNDNVGQRVVFTGTPSPVLEFNSLGTGEFRHQFHDGNDTAVGFIYDCHGWFARVWDLNDRDTEIQRSDVPMILADPLFLLQGFIDTNGNGVDNSNDIQEDPGVTDFGRDGPGPIDYTDIELQGILFDEFHARLATHIWAVELNRAYRFPREHFGGFWECFSGLRLFVFDEDFSFDGIGGLIADTHVATEARNRVLGPQIGFRYSKRNCRWTLSHEIRAMLALNFQEIDQQYSIGGRLSQRPTNDAGGSDIQSSDTPFVRSRFDAFNRQGGNNSRHHTELSPVIEVGSQASYLITRSFSVRIGVKAMYVDGIARPTGVMDYTFPTFGILDGGNTEHLLIAGGHVGFEWNR